MPLIWKELTEEEALALEQEGPYLSFLEGGVPTLAIDLSKEQPTAKATNLECFPDLM
jgi:hypothetical protein